MCIIFSDKVDRGHNDGKRLPGGVVEMTVIEERRYYKVACIGGVLKHRYLRADLIYEPLVTRTCYQLDEVFATWKNLKVINYFIK